MPTKWQMAQRELNDPINARMNTILSEAMKGMTDPKQILEETDRLTEGYRHRCVGCHRMCRREETVDLGSTAGLYCTTCAAIEHEGGSQKAMTVFVAIGALLVVVAIAAYSR
jgi:hypothetical protein